MAKEFQHDLLQNILVSKLLEINAGTFSMITNDQIKEALEKIINSDVFKTSQTYQNLLKYLVEASIKKESVKEFDIAIEIFGKNASFNPAEDPTVRVYISNLRKKLKKYYAEEGKHDKIRLAIPSGHYTVTFSHKKSTNSFFSFFSREHIAYLIILILLMIVGYMLLNPREKARQNVHARFLKSPIWKNIAASPNPLLVVLGDDYFFINSEDIQFGIHRYHHINSDSELENLKTKSEATKDLIQTPYTFTPHLSLIPLNKLLPLFCRKGAVRFENSSKIETADLLKNDILFLGSFRNLYILREALNNFLEAVKLGAGANQFTLNVGDSLKTFNLKGFPEIKHSDYCLVRKIPGPKNNTIFLFISFFESGMSSTSNYMTNPQSLAQLVKLFKNKYGSMPEYFNCVFQISGLERTALTIRVAYFDKIDPSKLKIW